MESVRLFVPVSRDVLPGSFVKFFGAVTTGGSVDYDTPISPRVRVWPIGATHPAHLRGSHLRGRHLNGVGFRGHLQGSHLRHGHASWEDGVTWRGGQYYGPSENVKTWRFGARLYDEAGRVSASLPTSDQEIVLVLNTSPRPPSGLSPSAIDSDGVTFTFDPSIDL